MRISYPFNRALIVSTLLLASVPSMATAVELGDGSRAFTRPPSLVKAVTTNSDIRSWYATYYFTVAVPENSGEPLSRLTITKSEGFDQDLDFDLKQTEAFEGDSYRKKNPPPIAIANAQYDAEQQQVTLTFDPPVTAGKTVTIGLYPYRNPNTGGVYLFDVTAYPPGDKPRSQFLGFGRLTFYEHGSYGH